MKLFFLLNFFFEYFMLFFPAVHLLWFRCQELRYYDDFIIIVVFCSVLAAFNHQKDIRTRSGSSIKMTPVTGLSVFQKFVKKLFDKHIYSVQLRYSIRLLAYHKYSTPNEEIQCLHPNCYVAIFCQIFETRRLKTLLNPKIPANNQRLIVKLFSFFFVPLRHTRL